MVASIRRLFTVSVLAASAFSQTVSEEKGNVYFKDKDGRSCQITSSGLDSDPFLSADGRLVVFVRRTPSLKIDTGLGDVDDNELWVVELTGTREPRRVLVGRRGGFKVDDNLVLAGFGQPQFSPDGRRIYFASTAWVTSSPVWMLDLGSGRVRFLYDGNGVEVLQSGMYAGYLIAFKNIPRLILGRIFRYWLLDPDGKDVGEIGERESDVEEFKENFLAPSTRKK